MSELERLMKEYADVLHRMKEEDDRYDTRRLAHEWWTWGITPPAECYYNVKEYVRCHPDEFRGVGPQ